MIIICALATEHIVIWRKAQSRWSVSCAPFQCQVVRIQTQGLSHLSLEAACVLMLRVQISVLDGPRCPARNCHSDRSYPYAVGPVSRTWGECLNVNWEGWADTSTHLLWWPHAQFHKVYRSHGVWSVLWLERKLQDFWCILTRVGIEACNLKNVCKIWGSKAPPEASGSRIL